MRCSFIHNIFRQSTRPHSNSFVCIESQSKPRRIIDTPTPYHHNQIASPEDRGEQNQAIERPRTMHLRNMIGNARSRDTVYLMHFATG